MPVMIGAKPQADFRNPIGMLSDCHRRIERFLGVLIRVTKEVHGEALNSEQRIALDTALRYFRDAAPKHTRDEEDSLFPRLRQADTPDVKPVLRRVETLEDEHGCMDTSHAEVDRLGQQWLANGTLPEADLTRLSELLAGLDVTYRQHIAVEETEVFPVAASLLGEADRKSMGHEMAERRGLAAHL